MNDAIEVPVDRIPLSPPGRPSKLFDELDELLAKKAVAEPPPAKAEETPSAGTSPAARKDEKPPTPAPKPRWVKDAVTDLLAWGRKRAVIATAAGSVVAGVLAINAMFGGAGRSPNDQPKDQSAPVVAGQPEPPKPTELAPLAASPFLPSPEPSPAPAGSGWPPPTVATPEVGAIPSPSLPFGVASGAPSVSERPAPTLTIPPSRIAPSVGEQPPVPAPSISELPPPSISTAPTSPDPTIIRTAAIGTARSSEGTGTSTPSTSPGLPGPAGPSTPAKVELPTPPLKVELPSGPPKVDLPGPPPPSLPTPAPTTPELPKPSLPSPSLPAPETPRPSLPAPSLPSPSLPAPEPTKPVLPPPGGTPEPTLPAPIAPVLPTPTQSQPDVSKPFPKVGFSAAEPTPTPGPFSLTKPSGDTAVRPVGAADATPPRTGYDVDLHVPKADDTYATISQQHYGDAKYAAALKAFNRNAEVAGVRDVEVPPMYVLRKQYAQLVGAGRPAESSADGRGVEWASTGGPAKAATTYTVPRDGMTLRDVAEAVYGSPKEWQKVWDANLNVMADEKLPAGKVLRLPAR